MPEFLAVHFSPTIVPNTGERLEPAWRVGVYCQGTIHEGGPSEYRYINLGFARKLDAEIARDSILAAGLNTVEKLLAAKAEINRIACENLQW